MRALLEGMEPSELTAADTDLPPAVSKVTNHRHWVTESPCAVTEWRMTNLPFIKALCRWNGPFITYPG